MPDAGDSSPDLLHAVHVTPWLSRRGGGVATAVWGYLRHARSGGWRGTAVGLSDPDLEPDTADDRANTPVLAGRLRGPASLAYSAGFKRLLRSSGPADVVHVHGLRHWPGYVAGREAGRRGVPLVLSPHGTLYPQVLAEGRWRKRLAAWLDSANLRRAAAIHATSAQEARHVRAAGVRAPVAVVGLGIDADVYTPAESAAPIAGDLLVRWPELSGKRLLLYLGFLRAKKGLERLAEAFAGLRSSVGRNWHIVLAGPDLGADGERIRAAFARHGLLDATTFTGPVWDLSAKLALLRAADVLVMPSDWENFGIAIGEALACGTPVIATRTAPWEQVVERRCGWWVDVGVAPLAGALAEACATSPEELREMGRRGRELIVGQFDWREQARRMGEVYRWARGEGARPAFLHDEGGM